MLRRFELFLLYFCLFLYIKDSFIFGIAEEMDEFLQMVHQVLHLLLGELVFVLVETTTCISGLVEEVFTGANHVSDPLFND